MFLQKKTQTKADEPRRDQGNLPFWIYWKWSRRVSFDLTRIIFSFFRHIKKNTTREWEKANSLSFRYYYALATLQSPIYFQYSLLDVFKHYSFTQQGKRTKRLEEASRSPSQSSFSRHYQMFVSNSCLLFIQLNFRDLNCDRSMICSIYVVTRLSSLSGSFA